MAEKRKKRKRKTKSPGSAQASASTGSPSGGSGGLLQSMRSGFRRAAGAEEPKEKPSKLSNLIWTLVFLLAAGVLIYRWYFMES
jgi:hypothetical protein